LGYGQITLSEQMALNPIVNAGAFGTYKADTSGFNSAEHTVCAATDGNEIQVDGLSGSTFTVDKPWAGFIVPSALSENLTVYGDSTFPTLAMVAGSGAYVSRNMGGYGSAALEPWAFELGLRYSTGGCPP